MRCSGRMAWPLVTPCWCLRSWPSAWRCTARWPTLLAWTTCRNGRGYGSGCPYSTRPNCVTSSVRPPVGCSWPNCSRPSPGWPADATGSAPADGRGRAGSASSTRYCWPGCSRRYRTNPGPASTAGSATCRCSWRACFLTTRPPTPSAPWTPAGCCARRGFPPPNGTGWPPPRPSSCWSTLALGGTAPRWPPLRSGPRTWPWSVRWRPGSTRPGGSSTTWPTATSSVRAALGSARRAPS